MTVRHAFCTIVTRSHLRGAAALAEGIARHHPEARLQTLILDPGGSALPLPETIVPHGLDDLALPDAAEMAIYYDAHALSNNLKPFFLRHLARAGHERLIFLDSDIMLARPLTDALDLLERHALLLTPHLVDPAASPRGEVALDVMADYGAYNGGFIAVRGDAAGLRILDWLCGRLTKTSLRFADQKILTLCAQLFAEDFLCVRDPSWNVAYWNLHERALSLRDDAVLVGDRPLTFFHFSGYRFERPGHFSAHSHRDAASDPALHSLVRDYDAAIARYAHLREESYGFAQLGGRRMTPGLRAYYYAHGTLAGYQRARFLAAARRLSATALRRS